jgi:vitamin B12 transporter
MREQKLHAPQRCIFKPSVPFLVLFSLLTGIFLFYGTDSFAEEVTSKVKDNSIEDDELTLSTILITPSRFAQPIEKVGSAVTVVTEAEIEARKEPNLLETLRNVEGLQVIQTGGPGRTTGMFLRGASPNQTLVMVDGIPVNEANSGLFDFADISTLSVGSVEIIRGPQSVMYGADAMGGVINIISKKIDEELQSSFTFEAGTYNTQRYVAKASGGNEIIRGSAGLSFFTSDNISVANRKRGNPENDPYDNLSFVGSIEADLPAEIEVKGTLRYTRARTSLDTFDFERGMVDALDFAQRRDSVQSSLSITRDFDWWTPTLLMGIISDSFEGMDSDNEFNNYEFESLTTSIQQQNVLEFSETLTGLAGYTYKRTDGENVGSFDERREVQSVFYEQQYSPIEETTVGAGIRYDHDSTFGDVTTYRMFFAQVVPALKSKLRSSYGTGFRAPTFNDLYFPGFSNDQLAPEKSRGFDAGVTSNFYSIQSDVTFFRTDYRNLIAFNTETFTPENLNRANVQGFETRLSWKEFSWFEPTISYTYMDSENEETGSSLPRRARHQGGFGILTEPLEKLKVSAFATFMADRTDSGGGSMDDYFVVSGTAQYEVYEGIAPFIRVQNLFNRDYEEVPGFGTLGASIFAGIQIQL